MGSNGVINLKTDSPDLFNFTKLVIKLFGLETLLELDDVYAEQPITADLQIKTHYESLDIAQSSRIHYLRFSLNKSLPVDIDEQLKQLLIEAEVG
jgi:tRNA (guanine-N7-)-methyltransferase